MSIAKAKRECKRQLGQFLTPYGVARAIVDSIQLNPEDMVLEPSFGTGAFIRAYADRLVQEGYDGSAWAHSRIHGCEIDPAAFDEFVRNWKFGSVPATLERGDFFRFEMPSYSAEEYHRQVVPKYDLVIGNPPFGGTIAADIQDELDSIFGFRHGCKIKKETYAFFIVKCLDLLKPGGRLVFVCSDTLLSINTMAGLRKYLMATCSVDVARLPGEFDETKQPMIVLTLVKGGKGVRVFGEERPRDNIDRTANSSWMVTSELARYFTGETLGDYFVASSGMTVGKNEYFLREIKDGKIVEPYEFRLFQRPITLEHELEKARLGKISAGMRAKIAEMEAAGATETAVDVSPRKESLVLDFPHPDYAPYNKATARLVYSPPTCAVYWRNEGEALYAFRKSGPWYLHGVGGKPYFRREGLTWQLISSHLNIRYLPAGYILDSGAPCAFLKDGVDRDEMYFALAWCLTGLCNTLLKKVINHTRNIQSKDFERMPYPVWVSPSDKERAISKAKALLASAMKGVEYSRSSAEIREFDDLFAMKGPLKATAPKSEGAVLRQDLFSFAS